MIDREAVIDWSCIVQLHITVLNKLFLDRDFLINTWCVFISSNVLPFTDMAVYSESLTSVHVLNKVDLC